MKKRVVVRILNVAGNQPTVLINCTGNIRCTEYTEVTEASGKRLLRLVEKYQTDHTIHRNGAFVREMKFLLKEVI